MERRDNAQLHRVSFLRYEWAKYSWFWRGGITLNYFYLHSCTDLKFQNVRLQCYLSVNLTQNAATIMRMHNIIILWIYFTSFELPRNNSAHENLKLHSEWLTNIFQLTTHVDSSTCTWQQHILLYHKCWPQHLHMTTAYSTLPQVLTPALAHDNNIFYSTTSVDPSTYTWQQQKWNSNWTKAIILNNNRGYQGN